MKEGKAAVGSAGSKYKAEYLETRSRSQRPAALRFEVQGAGYLERVLVFDLLPTGFAKLNLRSSLTASRPTRDLGFHSGPQDVSIAAAPAKCLSDVHPENPTCRLTTFGFRVAVYCIVT